MHSMPYGLTDQLRNPVVADFYVDVEKYIDNKAEMLPKHKKARKNGSMSARAWMRI